MNTKRQSAEEGLMADWGYFCITFRGEQIHVATRYGLLHSLKREVNGEKELLLDIKTSQLRELREALEPAYGLAPYWELRQVLCDHQKWAEEAAWWEAEEEKVQQARKEARRQQYIRLGIPIYEP